MSNNQDNISMSFDEIRILACLQEAGDETIFTLVNTLFSGIGDQNEVLRCAEALTRLATSGFISISKEHYKTTSLPNNANISQQLIAEFLDSSYSWISSKSSWFPDSNEIEYSAILTDKGTKASDLILRVFGWGILDMKLNPDDN